MDACVICHDPNPTTTSTCSPECASDLALANGHITDYPEETHMDTQITLPPMTDAEQRAYLTLHNNADHPHEPSIHCLSCRQTAINVVDAVSSTIRDEAQLAVHSDLVARHEAYEAHPDRYEPHRGTRRLTPREHSVHMVRELAQRASRYRLPDSLGVLPAGYVEAS